MTTGVMRNRCRVTSKPFEELTVPEVYEILRLRSEVFVVEQECAYQDIDGKDPGSWQVMVFDDSGSWLPDCVCCGLASRSRRRVWAVW